MKKVGLYTLGLTMLLAGQAKADEIYVRNVEVEGLRRVEVDTVLSYINVPTGQNVSQEKLDESLKQLYNTGLFTDVIFDVKNDGLLTIRVVENPIVNKRYFDGNDKVGEEMLSKEVSLDSLKEVLTIHPTCVGLRVLGNGEIKSAVTVKASYVTPSAKEKIEAAGGKVELV